MNNKIKVAVLASSFIGRNASGTAQTFKKLVTLLSQYPDSLIKITLLCKNRNEIEIIERDFELLGCEYQLLDSKKRKFLASSRQFYKYSWNNRKVKVFDILHYSVPRFYPFFHFFPARKFVATFHAGGDITAPRDKIVLSRNIYNVTTRVFWKKLDAIVADSNFAVNEICSAYKIPKKFITKIYLGSDSFWNIAYEKTQQNSTQISVIGRWQRYKNVHTALDAINDINENSKLKFKVTLVGKKNQLGKNLVMNSIKQFKGEIETYDFLPIEELVKLYRSSRIVIHPSINEGFGLPAFEAFAEGAILIVHKGTPASELLGSFPGVIVADLNSKFEMRFAIYEALKSSSISINERRNYLIQIGADWQSMASAYYRIYRKLTC